MRYVCSLTRYCTRWPYVRRRQQGLRPEGESSAIIRKAPKIEMSRRASTPPSPTPTLLSGNEVASLSREHKMSRTPLLQESRDKDDLSRPLLWVNAVSSISRHVSVMSCRTNTVRRRTARTFPPLDDPFPCAQGLKGSVFSLPRPQANHVLSPYQRRGLRSPPSIPSV